MDTDLELEESLEAAPSDDPKTQFEALQTVISALQPLGEEARVRIFDAASTFLKIQRGRRQITESEQRVPSPGGAGVSYPSFSADTSMSAKEFMLERQPRTDVERIACLAYYLTHYQDMPHFKTLDLSKLNTEAAQSKFSNAADASNNAVKRGYLVPSTKGHRQLSAAGEQFVRALPDRVAAKEAMMAVRPRRKPKRAKAAKSAMVK